MLADAFFELVGRFLNCSAVRWSSGAMASGGDTFAVTIQKEASLTKRF